MRHALAHATIHPLHQVKTTLQVCVGSATLTVGELLGATRRHSYRPAHIHFIAEAPGFDTLTTHIFVDGSPYLDSDAVFAVKQSLVRDFAPVDDPAAAAEHGLPNPFPRAEIDLVLEPLRESGPPA